ncbi:D-alanyl-D-alanine carboxypeptidase [Roseospira marina]|uniref:D-alanyl-D-alanine carboxypeptidase n=1 Tax=Roseospira marina TaxID=140057 RepID=A0A5M6IGP0_9PROT|nr:D-alanyl-D-alanine carboxypeptidase family protein [Roseospira marina]KAA5607443.1 D-alanyl-D-alanine carboxypeptidase [Roseospira marina]MBB4312378.1 D-alanyl-D-alanine carboxypeptidase [Roseospira marina]MBB5085606.1 D-alanyl-D-alanine carboxypeptidase [Roseospira marina]
MRTAARGIAGLLLVSVLGLAGPPISPARAFDERGAHIVVDAATGRILAANKPNHPRYPASLTKMMTVLMLFRALESGAITPQTPIPMSANAAAANPVKLGLAPGDSITVAEAIPALIARSANDVAVAVAEFLGGTEDAFAEDMTRVARVELGMSRTTFRNASGLPDDAHVTTARDMARLARTLWRDYAAQFGAFGTTVFHFRGGALPTYNPLLASYAGADGLKTGFTCAAGYNLAGTAQRNGHRVIAIVLGAGTSMERNTTITTLMDRGFDRIAALEDFATETNPAPLGLAALPTLDALRAPRPLRDHAAPDVEGCGGVYAGGWAINLGSTGSLSKARWMANQAAERYGGKALTVPVGTGGMVKHNAYVAALSAGQARSICAQRQRSGEYCVVRSPRMMWASQAAVQRLRRSMQ